MIRILILVNVQVQNCFVKYKKKNYKMKKKNYDGKIKKSMAATVRNCNSLIYIYNYDLIELKNLNGGIARKFSKKHNHLIKA